MILLNLAHERGLTPKKVALTQGGEYHSECPACGGTDRFIIQPNKQMKNCLGYYFCRQCGIYGDSIQFCREFLGLPFKEATNYVGGVFYENIPDVFAQKKSKVATVTINKPTSMWLQQADKIVQEAHANLLYKKDILDVLNKRGLPLNAIKLYKIGWLERDENIEGHFWGLEKETVWLPAGILIPTIEQDGTIIRLKIRRKDWKSDDELPKYVAITGNMSGLNIIGDKKNHVMIVVESELDAYSLQYTLGDIAIIVAIGGCSKNPDPVTDRLAKNKSLLLICHDNDDAGIKMLEKWKALYPKAQACPTTIGKDIGEAVQQGLDLRSWIIEKIPKKMQYDLNLIWKPEDQAVIDWFLNEKNLLLTPFFLKEGEDITEPLPYYDCLRAAILGGPSSWQAKTGRLQEILRLLKKVTEQNHLEMK